MRKEWTDEETELLKNLIGVYPVKTIAKRLGRTENSIYHKAYKLKISSSMVKNSEYITTLQAAEILDTTYSNFCSMLDKGIIKHKKTHRWGKTRIKLFDIDEILKFSEEYVKKNDTTAWTAEETDKLLTLRRMGYKYKYIAEKLGKTEDAVINKMVRIRKKERMKNAV